MCHESSGTALSESMGIGKGSVTARGPHEADCIVIAGQNPGTNHPRMLSALEKAKAQRREDHHRQPAARGGPEAVQGPAEGARRRRQRRGRIGRNLFRVSIGEQGIKDIVAVNDITDPKTLSYLLKHDWVLGNLKANVAL